MPAINNIVIGIQARSTSKRFPRKVFEMIDGKTVLQHVIDACKSCQSYVNQFADRNHAVVSTVLLVPHGDEIVKALSHRIQIIEGPDDDVLTRYKLASDLLNPDYIVRITADCPLMKADLIRKHIISAIKNSYDYCSNVDPIARTAIDGHDVEVMSKRALDWLNDTATELADREHVTTLLRSDKVPDDFRVGHIIGNLDQSHIKLSVDTPEDLERVKCEYFRRKDAYSAAVGKFNKENVHSY